MADDQFLDDTSFYGKRKRRPNFSENEKLQLLEELEKRKHIICPSSSSTLYISSRMKQDAWTQITEEMNRKNQCIQRSVMEVQKKWKNMCFAMKEEITRQKRKLDEVGSAPPLSELSLRVRDLWGDSPAAVYVDIVDDDSFDGQQTSESPDPSEPIEGRSSPHTSSSQDTAVKEQSSGDSKKQPEVHIVSPVQMNDISVSQNNNHVAQIQQPVPSSITRTRLPSTDHVTHSQQASKFIANGFDSAEACEVVYSSQKKMSESNNQSRPLFIRPTQSTSNVAFHAEMVPGTKRKKFDHDLDSEDLKREILLLKRRKELAELEKIELEKRKLQMEMDKLAVEKEKLILEKIKLTMELPDRKAHS